MIKIKDKKDFIALTKKKKIFKKHFSNTKLKLIIILYFNINLISKPKY